MKEKIIGAFVCLGLWNQEDELRACLETYLHFSEKFNLLEPYHSLLLRLWSFPFLKVVHALPLVF